MAGILDDKCDHHGTLLSTQPKGTNGLSTGHIGSLIIEMNGILRNEFYPSLESDRTCRFEEIWGTIQSLLCVEAISAAQNLAKAACDCPAKQPPAPSYAAVTQANLPSLPAPWIQPVPRALTWEVRVSCWECPDPVKNNLQDPAMVVPLLNQAIAQFSGGWVEAARALPSSDLILWVDSVQTQQELHKQSGWTEALGAGTQLNQPWFTVLVKSVHQDALDCSNQEVAQGTLSKQNPYLSRIELIHVGWERSCQADSPTRASTVLVNVASPQEANLIIQEGLVLGYVHHSVELSHRDCRVTRCYRCQGLGHMARACCDKACCGWCASQEHTNNYESRWNEMNVF